MNSSSSSSSSSSMYCEFPDCQGTGCSHFPLWNMSGIHYQWTTKSKLYAILVVVGGQQQIELYKDPSYYYLVSIGQRITAGIITMEARNDSGITGSVTWDGVPVSYSLVTIYCQELSSSSSSSSIDSSSTSSQSPVSVSSSSSNCCTNPNCVGDACNNFYNWTFSGLKDGNSDSCRLYVGLDSDDIEQQIWVYKDVLLTKMVALGRGDSFSNPIILNAVNDSGLSGSVYWNGIGLHYPNILILDCAPLSSSSSSSSSSIDSSSSSSLDSSSSESSPKSFSSSSSFDSSSSSSSSSYGYTSSSSSSSVSLLSLSSSSSSSSSSIDSSSESSESIGNFSSSSSSSLEKWNITKPLIFGHSSISYQTVKNRLVQTIPVDKTNISVKKVFCYLYGPYGNNSLFNINLAVFTSNDDGTPNTLLGISSISGATITQNGWYEFDFSIPETTINNYLLSIIMWQDGDSENNYALWGYIDKPDSSKLKTFISSDAVNWVEIEDTVFGVRVIESTQTLFDLDNFRIETPPAEETVLETDLVQLDTTCDATYDRTILETSPDRVEMNVSPMLISLVVDSSGSMGWNDRFGNRMDYANTLANRFVSYYPKDTLFDVIKFGGVQVDPNNQGEDGELMRINLDARSATRTGYIFTTSALVSAVIGAVYYDNENPFALTVAKTINNETILMCYGDSSKTVPDSGILTKISGSGDNTIEYATSRKLTVDNTYIIAYGFKNLIGGRTYNIGEIQVDDTNLNNVAITNWQLFHSDSVSPTISLGTNGPDGNDSVDIVATDNLVARSLFFTTPITMSNVSSKVLAGENVVHASNTGSFSVQQKIDLVDGDLVSYNHEIIDVSNSSTIITFSPSAYFDIKDRATDNGRVQLSSFYNNYPFSGTTLMLLIRDAASLGENITFFLQTPEGLTMEWDFKPFTAWLKYNIFWLGDTARLRFSLKDTAGDNLPDGTQVDILIDKRWEDQVKGSANVESQVLTQIAHVGSTKIYVEALEGFEREQTVAISGYGLNQTLVIKEIGTDSGGYYVLFYQPLQFTFNPSLGAMLYVPQIKRDIGKEMIEAAAIDLAVIDVTPITTGVILPPDKLEPYDPPQLPPTTDYSQVNFLQEYIRNKSHNVPSNQGRAVIRVLPITEDMTKSIEEKNDEAERLLIMNPPAVRVNQTEQNQGDLASIVITEKPTEDVLQTGVDYTVQTPVFSTSGVATSAMVSFANTFSFKTFTGLMLPSDAASEENSKLFTKTYSVNGSVPITSTTGVPISRQYLTPYDVDFASRYYIRSSNDFILINGSNVVKYDCVSEGLVKYFNGGHVPLPPQRVYDINYLTEDSGTTYYVNGFYADSGESYTINYLVTDKFTLLKAGQLKIRLYFSSLMDLEACAQGGYSFSADAGEAGDYSSSSSESSETDIYSQVYPLKYFGINIKKPDKIEVINGQTVTTPDLSLIDKWRNMANANSPENNQIIPQDRPPDLYSPFTFYDLSPIPNWIKAEQFEFFEKNINIVNGRASLEIPATDISGLLFVEASYEFGDGVYEAVRGDIVWIANPLSAGSLFNYMFSTQDENEKWELSLRPTLYGEAVPDGTTITYYYSLSNSVTETLTSGT